MVRSLAVNVDNNIGIIRKKCLFVQNLIALTAAFTLPVPMPAFEVPLPAAGIKSEVGAVEVSLEVVVKAEEAEDGLANLAQAFFHLH